MSKGPGKVQRQILTWLQQAAAKYKDRWVELRELAFVVAGEVTTPGEDWPLRKPPAAPYKAAARAVASLQTAGLVEMRSGYRYFSPWRKEDKGHPRRWKDVRLSVDNTAETSMLSTLKQKREASQ